uniref:Phosphoinositide 5-phosphatase n=1 Tax=Panagrolaimus sp. ES5 TaxID=591445 RepID=A0AC34GS00_9BILA
MSLRGYRIYSSPMLNGGPYKVLIESVNNNSYLFIQNSAITTLNVNDGNFFKNSFTKIGDGCGLMGILRMSIKGSQDGGETDDAYLIVITEVKSAGKINECDVYKIAAVKFLSLNREPHLTVDERLPELARLLSSGNFYFAYSNNAGNMFDLTLSAQRRHDIPLSDNRFFWNKNLYFPLERFSINADDWFVRCMCGSVIVRTIYVGHRTAKVGIISRLSCERVGTRFNVRGANDDGNVANFVETEQFISFENQESSFVQIRGSVPLFWEQPGIQVGSHSIRLRSIEASLPPLERHYSQLKKMYNNIATKILKASSHTDKDMINFDYHTQMKVSKSSIKTLQNKLDAFVEENGTFLSTDGKVEKQQNGTIRTNCLDCLDRTNCVQTLVGMKALLLQLQDLQAEKYKTKITARFEETLRDMWQKNGDQCSIIYAGTGALEGKSKIKDASRSIARTFQNNLMDGAKQESFDLFLLGNGYFDDEFDKASRLLPSQLMKECPMALSELIARREEMVSREPVTVFCGTWNVNGGKNVNNIAFRHEDSFEEWFYSSSGGRCTYDIVAIGLEEIVDLNASNMVKASTTNQRIFCERIKNTLAEITQDKYVVLACEQLVGVCLILCVRLALLSRIRDFAICEVKTGMGGATGNKGSVAARLTIDATSVCFVCSHFAAGQHEISNRNEDYASAMRKIRFPLGRTIKSHDVIFWLGDFNYRISLGRMDIKTAIEQQNYDYLNEHDQLTEQRKAGNVFHGFEEGRITFAPTYKYDTFSDDYDTSEKCRAPAWTDRILWKDEPTEKLVKLIEYRRSELRTSDHRPVAALYKLDVLNVNLKKCEQVFRDVVASLGPPDCMILCSVNGETVFPPDFVEPVIKKLNEELDIQCLMHTIEGHFLKIALPNGPMTLAALSMDGTDVGNGRKISVQLRTPDWEEDWALRMSPAFKRESSYINLSNIDNLSFIVNLNVDDDEEDCLSIDSARSSAMPLSSRLSPKLEDQILSGSPAPPPLPPSHGPPQLPKVPPRPASMTPRQNGSDIPVVPPRPSPVHWPPPSLP